MSLARLIAVAVLLVSLAACDESGRKYVSEGAGINLYDADSALQTQAQELYFGNICRQSGFGIVDLGGSPVCDYSSIRPADWPALVQTGMNDIDMRCDGYLSWLDSRRRSTAVIQQQILDTQTAANAIMVATHAGGQAISIAAAALGFASHTFTNINSRLLFEVEQSTVQALVLTRQNQFRSALPTRIDNKAAAVYALRSYLRLCMPMTIETQINTTIKLFERGGLDALADSRVEPMIDPTRLRNTVIRDVSTPLARTRRAAPIVDEVRRGDFEERGLSSSKIRAYRGFLGKPCEGGFTADIRSGILAALDARQIKVKEFPNEITAIDDRRLRSQPDFGDRCRL